MRSGFTIRLGLFLAGGWCLLLLVSFLSGLSQPQQHSVLARIGLFALVFLPSAGLFWWLLRKVIAHSQLLSNEAQMLSAKRKQQEAFVLAVRAASSGEPIPAVVQGGSGLTLATGDVVLLSCRSKELVVSSLLKQEDIPLPFVSLRAIDITGPGTVTQNAGVVGGGFGVQGALKGILVASVLNSITSKSSTNTFVRIGSRGSEVHLHVTTLEPRQVRLLLSPAFVAIESLVG